MHQALFNLVGVEKAAKNLFFSVSKPVGVHNLYMDLRPVPPMVFLWLFLWIYALLCRGKAFAKVNSGNNLDNLSINLSISIK